MDLAKQCVMEGKQDACKKVETLPQLADVADDADPADFMTPEELVPLEIPCPCMAHEHGSF